MKRTCIIGIILKYSIILYMTTAVWSLLIEEGRLNTAVFLFQKIEIEKQTAPYTSTKYRHEKAFQGTLRRYRQFASLYCSEVSTAVPGLESTNVLGEACDRMVPQGICVAGDYMLITAYDNLKAFSKTKGKKQANPYHSVLYVLSNDDPEKRRLLTTIVLPDVNHVGGVTFDGKNVWIAKSTTQKCSVIPYGVIKDAANSGKESYKLVAYGQNVDCGAVASFLTFRQGKLWIGTYSNRASGTGRLRNYDIQKEDTLKGERYRLKLCQEIVIPGFANGVEFLEQGNHSYMAVTTSKGRCFDSKIYLYRIFEDPFTQTSIYDLYKCYEFPPMAEELAYDGGKMYFLFESSATCYSAEAYLKCSYPVDRICALSAAELFWQNGESRYGNRTAAVRKNRMIAIYGDVYQERKYWKRRLDDAFFKKRTKKVCTDMANQGIMILTQQIKDDRLRFSHLSLYRRAHQRE